MKTPECGNCGGCPRVASCPLIASNREKVSIVGTLSIVAEKPPSITSLGKIVNFQAYKNFSGGPVPKESSGCSCGWRGICSECKNKKAA